LIQRQANLCVDQVNVVEDERNGLGREPPSTPGASEATSDDWWVHWSVSGRPRRPTSPNRIPCSARSSGHAPRWLMALYQHDLSITVSSRACPSRHQCPCRPLSRRIATRSRPHPTPASLRAPPRAALTPDSSASPSRRRRYASPRPASSRLSGFSVRGGVDLPRHCSFCQSDAAELLRRRGKRARKEAAARMSRRSVNPSRRMADGGLPSVGGLLHPKSRSPPVLTIALVVLVPPPPPLRPSHSIAADVVVVTCTSRLAF
jgi:hypothetical protein